MSKNTLAKEISKEINRLNAVIDIKIIKGLSYKKEAHRHKFLLSQLHSLGRKSVLSVGWFERVNQFVSTFAI